jgi:hypothetical protein
MLRAVQAGITLALGMDEFTSEDIWEALDGQEDTHEHRAMGPVMLALQRQGYIEPTRRYVTSRLPRRNAGPVQVWRSRR